MLNQQYEVMFEAVLTPRGESKAVLPAKAVADSDTDLQGNALAPAAVQPFNSDGIPLVRRSAHAPWVDPSTNLPLSPTTQKFSEHGQPLDAQDRPLPLGAVCMFTAEGEAISVGIDGGHYRNGGERVLPSAPHFDAQGTRLPDHVVRAADGITAAISVALQTAHHLTPRHATASLVVDVFGRSLQEHEKDDWPPPSGRRVVENGKVCEYKPPANNHNNDHTMVLTVQRETPQGLATIGQVECAPHDSLHHVRLALDAHHLPPGFVFTLHAVALGLAEEQRTLVGSLPHASVVVRTPAFGEGEEDRGADEEREEEGAENGRKQEEEERDEEGKKEDGRRFSAKVQRMVVEQRRKEREEAEFADVLRRVREGRFLRSTAHQ